MSDSNPYRLWIYGRDHLDDPEFIADLVDLGVTHSAANAITKVAWCLGLCILTSGTLEEMEQLQDALAAKGYQSKIDFRGKPRSKPSIWEDAEEVADSEEGDSDFP